MATNINIPGYQISEQLYNGYKTLVYRGYRQIDQQPVVIKLLKNPYPSFNELVQFRNQYTITKNLDFPGIIQTYNLETYQNSYALIMEDMGGISLKDYFTNVETLYITSHDITSLQEFLSIAISLCDILQILYQQRIIHKDIKPANILINPQTKQIKLIDFSIASLLPRETQEIKSPNILEGTLAYISPEQTGRMNRGIDYRSDFYSLGVTFYEILTGQLPFQSDDVMELLHSHIAKTPVSINSQQLAVNGREIPQVLDDIIHKLMAKNAEDRYQSALGLKHDLENCLKQLQETGKIEDFQIGKRDICDRFIIPEKLYGREQEVEALLAAFERVSQGNSELMLVAGFSGIGKTAVVNEVQKPIVKQRGYFIKGKFDQFNRNIPLSAFVQALRDLIGQLLSESDTQLLNWKNKILHALGENAQVIIDVIPELESIIGKQSPASKLSGTAAQNRFNLLFKKFLQVFTQAKHPLVMFLDDLQWADLASLNLIQLLMTEAETEYLLIIGAYRNNEIFAAHPLILTLDDISKKGTTINTILLKHLTKISLNNLIADTLKCAVNLAKPLTEILAEKTQGNPFFTTQFLKALYQNKLINFDYQARYWQCDIVRVREAALTDDVVEFMTIQLQKLSETTQHILKLAACIGNQFDLNTLEIIAEKSTIEITTALWLALQEGLILAQSQIYKFYVGETIDHNIATNNQIINYKFLHDRVQQAAYSLIAEDEKAATHLKIGQLLLEHTPEAQLEEKIFDLVNQYKLGIDLITQPQEQKKLAQLTLIAARKAKNATAYSAATQYYQIARRLLANYYWQQDYNLMLAIYTEATEVAYLNTDFEQMEQLAEIALQQAQDILDTVPIYETKIQACVAQNQLRLGIDTALTILHQLGINLPANPNPEHIAQALGETDAILTGKNPLELTNLPMMTDKRAQAAMGILSSMFGAVYNGFPSMLPLTTCQQVNLSVQYGNTPLSAFAYATYGLILSAFTGATIRGYQFGQLALTLMEKFSAPQLAAKITAIFNDCIRHWQDPLHTTLKPLLEGYQIGLQTGDLEWSVWCIFSYSFHSYCAGKELTELEQELATYSIAIAQCKQTTALNYQKVYHQAVLNLLGRNQNPEILVGDAYNEDLMLPQHQQVNDRPAVYHLKINKLMLCYLFGNYEQAIAQAVVVEQYLDGVPGLFVSVLLPFYDSLAQLAISSTETGFLQESRILQHKEKLQQFATLAPSNHLHKFYLVEAEYFRVLGKYSQAIELYERAITGAKENNYLQEQALANELAAKFYLNWGKEKIATSYIQEAYYCYAKWGAKAKIAHLEQNYPQLLAAILQAPNVEITDGETITSTLMRTLSASNSSQNFWLDMPTLMKAAQAISGEIELDKLLGTLMQIAIANAGAQKGYLILQQNKQWLVVTKADSQKTQRLDIPLEQYQEIPQSVIYAVMRSQEVAVFDHLSNSVKFAGDSYIINHQPKSVLCTPINQQGKLIGILYLENNLTTEAFTSDRLQVIQLLTAQAAISLQNSQLYHQLAEYSHSLEQKVLERTQEVTQKATQLESTLEKLYATQAQLIQAEKMSSLGQLVAGIAHEINNPINFIYGNLTPASEYVTSLIELNNLYQKNYPQPIPEIEKKIADVELDFMVNDLQKLLKSIEIGAERIRQIVLSLRNFSRLDEAEVKSVDIHEGIDSTLLILQHCLQNTRNNTEISIVKEYSELPLVTCYPSALNQVFMNILTNAIDALKELNLNHQPTITIRTQIQQKKYVSIHIIDNGMGMNETVQNKMFEPFFTTKPVGSGTGLGLSISYSIVVEQHGGNLNCISAPGKGTEFIIEIPL
ncbi:ATP-binding sensor histidine kinase [Plectonema radiosum]